MRDIHFFIHYVDKRSFWEKAQNAVGLTGQDVGRSFALIAGVSYYPNMPVLENELKPVEEDISKLTEYLKNYEFFDEIVLIKNQNMTYDNLAFFLQNYFPERLKRFPKSRFLFAYSGHGMSEGANGYLLKNTARNLSDKNNSIPLKVVRVLFDEVIESGHHVLALINACYSGSFIKRSLGRQKAYFIPVNPGAHAITAGGSGELAWADPEIGEGSIFFEKLFAGLDGRADYSNDGIITVHELSGYLRQEVQIFTDQSQNPQVSDISKHGSLGEFFFLNRKRQIEQRVLPEWKPDKLTPLGIEAEKMLAEGKKYYNSKDYERALPYFNEAAEANNSEAMTFVGYMYEKGLGVAINNSMALYWYRRGAEAGNSYSMNNLGWMLLNAIGVDKNPYEAEMWLRKSVKLGNALAMTNIGGMYRDGLGGEQDYDKAFQWYQKGADAGNDIAMNNLGWLYEQGFGVEKNYQKAAYWYKLSADAGNAYAMTNLGWFYENGLGVEKSDEKAVYWYKLGAEAGNAQAMNNYGWMLLKGRGIEMDQLNGENWLRKAADAGNQMAMTNLGWIYRDGLAGEQNYYKAFFWYKKGAEAGNDISMTNLGWLYENGFGTEKNYNQAVYWYRKAASLGNNDAQNSLNRLGEWY